MFKKLFKPLVVLFTLLSMLLTSQYVMANQIHQIAHRMHGAHQHRKQERPTSASSGHKKKTAQRLGAGKGGITSNAFNFSSMYSGHVDGRTGTYSFNASLGKVYGNGGFGPNYTYGLQYSSSNRGNSGYGFGWGVSLSHYNKTTQNIKLFIRGQL